MTEQQAAGMAARPLADARTSTHWTAVVATTGRHWGLHTLNGTVMVLIGIAALVWPDASLLVVSWLFAITLLVNGVVQILRSVGDTDVSGGRRALFGLLGALSLLAGVLCLRSPLQTLGAIALLIGAWWVVSGVLMLVAAVGGTSEGSRAWAAALGVLSVLAGFVVLLQPGMSLAVLTITLGVSLIVLGVVVIVDGVRMRSRT